MSVLEQHHKSLAERERPDEHRPAPCPFCGCDDLGTGTLYVDEGTELVQPGDIGEIDTIHCRRCLAEAPAQVWGMRPEVPAI